MFVYITINKPEMRFREFDVYHSYYCGFCRTLKANFGISGQATLTYDLTFLIMLLTGLYEPEEQLGQTHCIAHPIVKQATRINRFSEYAADMNILLAYYKCRDDWTDEHSPSKLMYSEILKRKFRHIEKKYSHKAAFIKDGLDRIHECEEAGEENIDKISGLFGEIFAEIFCYQEDNWSAALRRIGFFLGKFIYILDACDDIEKDIKKGSYNPFKKQWISDPAGFDTHCSQLMTMMISECCRAFELLPILQNVEILRNILYSGVWVRFEAIHKRRNKKLTQSAAEISHK
jgi:hypothetical protein